MSTGNFGPHLEVPARLALLSANGTHQMIVGIMSDSHGDANATARAVSVLESHGAQVLFHCGDICAMSVLDELAGRKAHFVWGNCDSPDI